MTKTTEHHKAGTEDAVDGGKAGQPTVSVALATYNGASHLREQLDSLARQTRLPDELVVTDDGSTDGTLEVLDDFRKRAPFPVRVERNRSRLGFVRNFEKAIGLCSGDILFLCDQDDFWLSEKIENVIGLLAQNPALAVVVNDMYLAGSDLQTNRRTLVGAARRAGLPDTFVHNGCCSAHRREWHELALPVPDGFAHDYWINGLAHQLGCSCVSPLALQLYRRHGSTATEWALTNPAAVSATGLALSHAFRDARQEWRPHARFLDEIVNRVRSREGVARRFLGDRLETQLTAVEARRDALLRRIEICSMPRWRRLLPALAMWKSGSYRSGWKSVAKDLVHP